MFLKYLTPIIFFVFSYNLYGEPTTYCEKFIEEIRQNQISQRLDWGPRPVSLLEAGFYLKSVYKNNFDDFDKKWGLSRNDQNEIVITNWGKSDSINIYYPSLLNLND